jgi:hypothetical protein
MDLIALMLYPPILQPWYLFDHASARLTQRSLTARLFSSSSVVGGRVDQPCQWQLANSDLIFVVLWLVARTARLLLPSRARLPALR